MTNDLTKGKPFKLIMLFSLPLLIGNLFQQLYGMVDALIVGQTLGFDALAGVGSTGAISFLVIGFVTGLTSGYGVVIAQEFGAKKVANVRRSIATSFMLCIVMTVILTVVSVLTTMPLLKLMNTPADIINDAYNYIVTIYYGLAAAVFYNMMAAILRALGDSKTPLIFLIVASVINALLDLLFIVVFKTGVEGAGWATVISQGLSGLLCLVYSLIRFPILRLKKEDFKTDGRFIGRHMGIALPMAFQFSITAVGVMVQQTALNGLGKLYVGAYTAASKVDMLSTQTMVALGTAMATYVGQNYGAGEYGRIRKGVKAGLILMGFFVLLGFFINNVLGGFLTRLFVKDITPEVTAIAKKYLLLNSSFYVFLGLIFIYRNALQGMGRGALTMLAGTAELVMRVVAAFVLVRYMGFNGLCLSNPFAWIGADLFLLPVYYFVIKKYKDKPSCDQTAQNGADGERAAQEQQCGGPSAGDTVYGDELLHSQLSSETTVTDSQLKADFSSEEKGAK